MRDFGSLALPIAGIALLGVGIAFSLWTASHPASFGWFAYSPLDGTRFNPTTGSGLSAWSAVLSTAGLVVLAFWAGLLVGGRPGSARGGP